MDYQTTPDLPTDGPLTVDHVMLFQTFQQEADLNRLDELMEVEFQKHLRLCEVVIMRAARSGCNWAELPEHPWSSITIWCIRHLGEQGFELTHTTKRINGSDIPEGSKEPGVSVTTVHWRSAKPLDPEKFTAEFRRRLEMEARERERIPVVQRSIREGDKIRTDGAIWAAILDGEYVVEVQTILRQNLLCLFDFEGKCLHSEKTAVAYSAMFGPDSSDLAHWEERAIKIVSDLKGSPPDPSAADIR